MTDRLTDEQVRELWDWANTVVAYVKARACWDVARESLPPGTGYEDVRVAALHLMSNRGIDPNAKPPERPDFDTRWLIPLLAEVRRARGME